MFSGCQESQGTESQLQMQKKGYFEETANSSKALKWRLTQSISELSRRLMLVSRTPSGSWERPPKQSRGRQEPTDADAKTPHPQRQHVSKYFKS